MRRAVQHSLVRPGNLADRPAWARTRTGRRPPSPSAPEQRRQRRDKDRALRRARARFIGGKKARAHRGPTRNTAPHTSHRKCRAAARRRGRKWGPVRAQAAPAGRWAGRGGPPRRGGQFTCGSLVVALARYGPTMAPPGPQRNHHYPDPAAGRRSIEFYPPSTAAGSGSERQQVER